MFPATPATPVNMFPVTPATPVNMLPATPLTCVNVFPVTPVTPVNMVNPVISQPSRKRLMQQRLLQRLQRGELALVDGGQALGFSKE